MSTFDFHGESFTYAEEFPAFEHAEFCEAIDDGESVNSVRSTAVVLRLAMASIAEADRAKFRSHCRKVHPPAADIMGVFKGLTEALTERPTGLPTDSSDGHEATEETSEPEPVASVTSLPARPDLALADSRARSAS